MRGPFQFEHEIDQREIVRDHLIALRVPFYQTEGAEEVEDHPAHAADITHIETRAAHLQLISLRVELGQAMAWTWHEVEQLRHRVEEVEHLRYEEEQRRLAEVAEDANHRECHPREVAECVSDEHF